MRFSPQPSYHQAKYGSKFASHWCGLESLHFESVSLTQLWTWVVREFDLLMTCRTA
jgi:hypothetical protein